MFGRRKKKSENPEKNESIADVLNQQAKKIEAELMKLEEMRSKGEISDEEYFEMRKRMESLKKQMENL